MSKLKNKMIVKGSDKLKFCGGNGDDGHLTFASSSRKNTCHSEVNNLVSCDVPIKKRHNTATMSLISKRPFEDNNSLLNNSVKKSKVTSNDTPLLRKTTMVVDTFDELFSSKKKDNELAKKLFEECKRKKLEEEEKTLVSIESDHYSKGLETMIKKMSCVEGIKDSLKEMEGKIGECVMEFVVKEARQLFMDLIRERKEFTVEIETKEREIDAMKRQIHGEVESFESEKKDFELAKKRYEEQVNALRLREEMCKKREMDLELKDKLDESRKKDLYLKEKQVEIGEAKVELKNNQLEIREKEMESKKKQRDMEFQSKEKTFNAMMHTVKSFVSQIEDLK
jgi:hypothetical protein